MTRVHDVEVLLGDPSVRILTARLTPVAPTSIILLPASSSVAQMLQIPRTIHCQSHVSQ